MTRCGSRRTGSPTTSTSGTSSGTRVRIRSTSARSRPRSASASARTARSEAAAATIAGTFSKPGARPRSRSSAGPARRTGRPCAPRAARRPPGRPTCGRSPSAATSAPVHRPPAQRLRRVHQQRHARRRGRPRPPRPPAAPCPPRGWRTGGRPARCPARSAAANAGGDPARTVHRDLGHRAAVRLVGLGRVQHAGVLDRGDHQVTARPATARQGPGHRRVHRPGPRRGEGELVRPAADRLAPRSPARRPAAAGPAGPPGRAGPGRPSPRPARPAAPGGRRGAGERWKPRRSRARGHANAPPATRPMARPRTAPARVAGGLPYGPRRWPNPRWTRAFHPFGAMPRTGRVGPPPRVTPNASSRVWSA